MVSTINTVSNFCNNLASHHPFMKKLRFKWLSKAFRFIVELGFKPVLFSYKYCIFNYCTVLCLCLNSFMDCPWWPPGLFKRLKQGLRWNVGQLKCWHDHITYLVVFLVSFCVGLIKGLLIFVRTSMCTESFWSQLKNKIILLHMNSSYNHKIK